MADNYSLTVIKQTQTNLVIEVSFEKPEISFVSEKGEKKSILKIEGLLSSNEPGQAIVPFLSKPFSLAGQELDYKVEQLELGTIKCDNYVTIPDIDSKPQQLPKINSRPDYFEINYQGMFRDVPIYSLNIFPIKVSQMNGTASWIKFIKIHIWVKNTNPGLEYINDSKSSKEKHILKNMLLNGENVNYKKFKATSNLKTGDRYKSGRYKILVKQDGIYQVTYQDLINAGINVSLINPRKLRLFNKGQEIAIYFKGAVDLSFDPGDYFEFWGEKNKKTFLNQHPDMYQDPFTDVNVYWLENSTRNGLRMVEESGALTVSNPANYVVPIFFKESIHFENDHYYEHFGQQSANLDLPSHTLDLWYYDSGISAVGSRTYTAYLPHPWETRANSVFVKTMMRGKSYYNSSTNPLESHQVEIWLNDKKVVESGIWKNQEMHSIENSNGVGLSQSDIHHGENEFRIVMDQTGVLDVVMLNWFDISYLRKYRADKNFINFIKQEGIPSDYTFQFEIDGFSRSDIEVYKKGVSKIVNSRIDFYTNQNDNYSSYRLSFQDQIFYSDIEYVALTSDKKKKPVAIIEDFPWIPDATGDVSLLDQSNKAEYLIITQELLYDNVLQLKEYHEQKGLSVEIVKVQDIYDEFNYGIKSPLAIKDFLTYVYENWDQSAQLYYVNLVGAASENYKTNSTSKPDLVPTFLFQTKKYGSSGSDFLYSLISGGENDIVPDLVISRIPAKNNSEFLNYFDKLQNYESASNSGIWTNKALMISGNDASTNELNIYPHAFRAQNQRILNYKIPDAFFSRKLNTVRNDDTTRYDPNFGGTTDLINYWDDGLIYINFFGHGGGGIWADVQLFNLDNIDRLNNGYLLPFVTSMTCFTGAFENKSLSGIAEKLITVAEKGAIGVYASTGLGWLHNDFAIGWALTENLFEKKLTIGESVLLSKIFYLANNVYVHETGNNIVYDYYGLRKSMVNQYNLLGEPFVYLPIPDDNIEIEVNNSLPAVGDTLNVTVNTPYSSGEIRIELTNEDGEQLLEDFSTISSGSNKYSFVIPGELDEQVGYVKVYATDNISNSHGAFRIAVRRSLLDSVVVTPKNPQVGDSVYLAVHLHSEIPVQTVRIKNLYNSSSTKTDFNLSKVNDSLFTSSDGLGPFTEMGTWYFTIEITDSAGNSIEYHQQKFTIADPRPDLSIVENSFSFQGNSNIEISVKVKNNSTQSIAGAEIGFFVDTYTTTAIPFYSTMESFLPNEKISVEFPVDTAYLEKGRKFIAVVDYQDLIDERDKTNNIDSSLVYQSFVMVTAAMGTVDTLSIGDVAKMYIPQNSLSKTSTMNYSLNENIDILKVGSQPGFKYIPFGSQNDSAAVHLQLNNPETKILTPVYLAFKIDTSMRPDSLAKVGVYRFSSGLNQWEKVPDAGLSDGYKVIYTDNLGDFALYYVNDSESPVIEITMNGRSLRNDMLIPATPELAFILQDENGINISNGFLVKLDGDTIPKSEMNMPDSINNSNAISVLTSPRLSIGEHSLVVEAADANGNISVKPVNFVTSNNFDIIVYGNYPNPFSDETYISYYVDSGGLLDEFSVKIYTVSGRMIKKIDTSDPRFREPDYYEVYWDGRDDDGNLVANGVYFAIIKAKHEGKDIEHRLKLAKLK